MSFDTRRVREISSFFSPLYISPFHPLTLSPFHPLPPLLSFTLPNLCILSYTCNFIQLPCSFHFPKDPPQSPSFIPPSFTSFRPPSPSPFLRIPTSTLIHIAGSIFSIPSPPQFPPPPSFLPPLAPPVSSLYSLILFPIFL